MKKFLLPFVLLFLLGHFSTMAQVFNNFDGIDPNQLLEVSIDTSNAENIWQIGPPQKMRFYRASSIPNALLTDTINNYPINNHSSFDVRVDLDEFWAGFPYFLVTWQQKLDCEIGVDGAVIEVSYDSMTTWVNIFADSVYTPIPMMGMESVELASGELGMSQIDSDWQNVGFCWTGSSGPFVVGDLFLRFHFYSDSIDTQQEGWMIDNMQAFPTLIDPVEELRSSPVPSFSLSPNPVTDFLQIDFDDANSPDAYQFSVFDMQGRRIYQSSEQYYGSQGIDTGAWAAGMYWVVVQTKTQRWIQKVVKSSRY